MPADPLPHPRRADGEDADRATSPDPAQPEAASGAEPVLTMEQRKQQFREQRAEKLAQLEAKREMVAEKERAREAARMRRQVEEMAALDDEDDHLLEQLPAGGTAKQARKPSDQASAPPVAPPAPAALAQRRHWLSIASFVAIVLLPTLVAGGYLWTRAADRYASYVGFSVRTEEISSAFELLGGVANLSGSSSSDTDILYRFIQSQDLVARIDAELDLRRIWSGEVTERDPVFAYHSPGTIEDLTDYWSKRVSVYSDGGTGLIDVEVEAFDPKDAQAIAQLIYDESSRLINGLSAIAREDALRYTREELDTSVDRLKQAREALTLFRNRTQIVDPAASIQSQMGLLSSLQMQLAQTLIDLDILRQSTGESDPRVSQAERRVEVIEARMQEERDKLGLGVGSGAAPSAETGGVETDGDAFADLIGEYERLQVDLQFAQQAYTAALAGYDSALAETRRQSRYLAAHVTPTLAEAPRYPERLANLALVAIFSFLIWSILVLSGYALKDRR